MTMTRSGATDLTIDFPGGNSSLPAGISATDVSLHLEKILKDDLFAHSQRLQDFLRYIVSRMLAGNAGQIKEYSIAVDVFGRRDSFDSRIDPVVRVEAHRLRSKLHAYAEKQAGTARLLLELPKGAYVPVVQKQIYAISNTDALPPLGRDEISIGVLPFLDLRCARVEGDLIADSLTEEIIHKLTDEPELQVPAWTSVAQFRNHKNTVQQIAGRLKVSMLIEGSIRQLEQHAHVKTRVINVRSGFGRTLGTYDREMNSLLVNQQELADTIVADLKSLFRQSANGSVASGEWRAPALPRWECG